MKKIFTVIAVCVGIGSTVAAEDFEALDVFEEFAASDAELVTEDMFIEAYQNQPVDGVLKIKADERDFLVEIVSPPANGSVVLTGTRGEFTYTPAKDWLGTDSFQFRVSRGGENSNISRCGVTIYEAKLEPDKPDIGFVYEDMRNHWANYSAVKLVERDILKGERIGNRYYFHPETKMRRIDVIEYILAALKADFSEVNDNETHIFADSTELPEYINRAAYLANKIGFAEGVRDGDKIYLKPYDYITRVEIIKMVDTAMRSKTRSDTELNFIDKGSIPDWAVQSVKNLVGYGIIQGFDDRTLRPFENITKAQVTEMLYQMIKYNDENATETMAMRIKKRIYGKIVM